MKCTHCLTVVEALGQAYSEIYLVAIKTIWNPLEWHEMEWHEIDKATSHNAGPPIPV